MWDFDDFLTIKGCHIALQLPNRIHMKQHLPLLLAFFYSIRFESFIHHDQFRLLSKIWFCNLMQCSLNVFWLDFVVFCIRCLNANMAFGSKHILWVRWQTSLNWLHPNDWWICCFSCASTARQRFTCSNNSHNSNSSGNSKRPAPIWESLLVSWQSHELWPKWIQLLCVLRTVCHFSCNESWIFSWKTISKQLKKRFFLRILLRALEKQSNEKWL